MRAGRPASPLALQCESVFGDDFSGNVCINNMNEQTKSAAPVWYWVVATIALLWNLMGCAAFAMELFAQEAMMESWTEAQREWAQSIPTWIYIAYGLAVITGVAGSIGLFLRKSWVITLFAVCLAAVLVQMIYTMIIAGGLQVMGPSSAVMPLLVIILAGVFLWFSYFAKTKRWL